MVAIIANAAVSFGRDYLRQKRDLILVTAAALLFLQGFSPIMVISMASLAGLILYADQGESKVPERREHAQQCQAFQLSWLQSR